MTDIPEDYPDDEDSVEEFEQFLERGGAGHLDDELAKDRAMRKQKIRNGEISQEALMATFHSRVTRLLSLFKLGAPPVILACGLKMVQDLAQELRITLGYESDEELPL